MKADIDVFRPFFSHRITGDEDRALVIAADGDWFKLVAKLPHKGMHPDYLAATITEHHIFGFCGGERNCSVVLISFVIHPGEDVDVFHSFSPGFVVPPKGGILLLGN